MKDLKARKAASKRTAWRRSGRYTDIIYQTWDGIAKITINRPEVRNAFRPTTVFEMSRAFEVARDDPKIGVVILTGAGTEAFCSGGDQRIRGDDGYIDPKGTGRLNVLDLQVQIRRLPKPVIAMVAGYAIGGGHVLHVVCDLTIAADNARFGQTGPRVGSFDGGYGAGLLARIVGQKKAREIWFLCEQYDAQQALDMGLVNKVVPLADLETETVAWCRRMLELSPLALRLLKAGLNAADDGLAGIQQLAGDATLALLHERRGAGGEGRVRAETQTRFLEVSKAAVTTTAAVTEPGAGVVARLAAGDAGRFCRTRACRHGGRGARRRSTALGRPRRARGCACHADRCQPRQRLLRLRPRRGHAAAHRAAASVGIGNRGARPGEMGRDRRLCGGRAHWTGAQPGDGLAPSSSERHACWLAGSTQVGRGRTATWASASCSFSSFSGWSRRSAPSTFRSCG